MRFRLRPGEDGSCLNLYKPTSPRIVRAGTALCRCRRRFRFAASIAETDAERQNPWRLLDREFADGAVAGIGDANSLQYVLHVGVGEDVLLPGRRSAGHASRRGRAVRQPVPVGARHRRDAVRAAVPAAGGLPLLHDSPPEGRNTEEATALGTREGPLRLRFRRAIDRRRLASYHRVENTYLSTFQALGGLGLLLGTSGWVRFCFATSWSDAANWRCCRRWVTRGQRSA